MLCFILHGSTSQKTILNFSISEVKFVYIRNYCKTDSACGTRDWSSNTEDAKTHHHWTQFSAWGSSTNLRTSQATFLRFFSFTRSFRMVKFQKVSRLSQWPRGLRRRPWSLGLWNRGFESRLIHGCLSSSIHHYYHHSLLTLPWTLYSLVTEKASKN
jgi:hypothetical protein